MNKFEQNVVFESSYFVALPEHTACFIITSLLDESMLFVDFSVNCQPIFIQDISRSCPNIGKNFVKLYTKLQKLDHLTCSKLKI